MDGSHGAGRFADARSRHAGEVILPEADCDDAAEDQANLEWARELVKALEPFTVGTYLDFPGMLEDGERQLRSAPGPHFDRLVDVKRRWDPTSLFRLNHNIPPHASRKVA